MADDSLGFSLSRSIAVVLRKELGENFKWASLSCGFMTLGLLVVVWTSDAFLLSEMRFKLITTWGPAAIGLFLGGAQASRREGRSTRFVGRVAAGLTLYLVSVGLPFLGLVAWAAQPGRYAEPFCWALILPGVADITCGVVYYFVGFLAGLHTKPELVQSPPMFLAVGCSLFVLYTPSFWLATGTSLSASAVIATAAWGRFRAVDGDIVEPMLAKLANRSMALTAVLLAAGVILGLAFFGYRLIRPSCPPGRYEIASDGRLLRVTYEAGAEKVAELDGSSVKEPHGSASAETILTRGRPAWIRPHYRNPWSFLICARREGSAWYFLKGSGRYVGYDIEGRERIGTIGPDGFVPEGEEPKSRFFGYPWRPMAYRHPSGALAERVFDTQIFSVDLRQRSARKVFQAPPGQRVLCAAPLGESRLDSEKDLAVLTDDRLVVIDPDSGKAIFRIKLDASAQKFDRLRVARLDHGHYVVWYQPARTSVADAWEAPSLLVEYDAGGLEVRRQEGPLSTRRGGDAPGQGRTGAHAASTSSDL